MRAGDLMLRQTQSLGKGCRGRRVIKWRFEAIARGVLIRAAVIALGRTRFRQQRLPVDLDQ
jgi:hypothetical protein